MEQGGGLIRGMDRLSVAFCSTTHRSTQSAFQRRQKKKEKRKKQHTSSLLTAKHHHSNLLSSFPHFLSSFYFLKILCSLKSFLSTSPLTCNYIVIVLSFSSADGFNCSFKQGPIFTWFVVAQWFDVFSFLQNVNHCNSTSYKQSGTQCRQYSAESKTFKITDPKPQRKAQKKCISPQCTSYISEVFDIRLFRILGFRVEMDAAECLIIMETREMLLHRWSWLLKDSSSQCKDKSVKTDIWAQVTEKGSKVSLLASRCSISSKDCSQGLVIKRWNFQYSWWGSAASQIWESRDKKIFRE